VNGRLYVGSEDKNLYCLDTGTGGLLWTYQVGAGIESSPAVADGKVYLGPDDGNVYCLDAATGSLIWKTPVGGYIEANFDSMARLISSPALVGGKVYVGSLDDNLYCLDANSGSVKWTVKTAGYITSSPAVVDGAVYFTSQEPNFGALYKLDANNGTRIWKLETPYTYILENGTDMQASPTVAGGMVFSSSNKYERYGVDAATGKIEWTYQAINKKNFQVDSIAYHDGEVLFADQFFIACVNAANGKVIWKSWIGSALNSSPTYANGKVYVVADEKSIYVLNATNGERLSWFATGSKSWSSPTIYEGKLYVGNNDWNVYCLAEDPVQNSNLTVNLAKTNISLGDFVTGSGQLVPGMTNVTIDVNFIRPDGTMDYVQTATADRGVFNFSYALNVAGNWTVIARWQSTEGRYSSNYSAEARVEVTSAGIGMPVVYFFVVIPIVALVAVAAAFMVHRRRTK
jgi:outer membrane protein assembly factor BamB